MRDPELAVQIAIECLTDTGLSISQIDSQIAQWMQMQGDAGHWWEMPEELVCRLARSLQKAFEKKYGSQTAPNPGDSGTGKPIETAIPDRPDRLLDR